MARLRSLPIVAALCLLLGGCFISEEPKLPLESATAPFGDGGRYGVYERLSDGNYRRQETFVIKRLANGGYEIVNEKGVALPITFHEIGNGRTVGQTRPKPDRPAYGYVVLTRSGAETFLHLPQCSDQDPALLAAHGVVKRGKFECLMDGVAQPEKLFAEVTLGNPASKLVAE